MWDRKQKAAYAEEFDAFYRAARADLLVQTYAVTGDLNAAHSAVRDAFIVAWQHWSKVRRLDDRDGWVRPLAWARARRRHTTRPWSRRPDVGAEQQETLGALRVLTTGQRKALVLVRLAGVPVDQAARDLGISKQRAAQELKAADAEFAASRAVALAEIPKTLSGLRVDTDTAQLPRTTIITRAGAVRRRTHTLIGAGVAAATLVTAGLLVTDSGGSRPVLAEAGVFEVTSASASSTEEPATPAPSAAPGETPLDPLPEYSLLYNNQIPQVGPKPWRVLSTTRNTDGNGLTFPCQGARYADPSVVATYVRTFRSGTAGARKDAGQAVEVSSSPKVARKTFKTTRGWFGACAAPKMQLLDTRDAPGIGDDAILVTLRGWGGKPRSLTYGVARTGAVTTTTMLGVRGDRPPGTRDAARMLAAAVDALCRLPGGGTCTRNAKLTATTPVRMSPGPEFLHALDLPPVGVGDPWVAADPAKLAGVNLAATRCDDTTFGRTDRARTRTFVIPTARLPRTFGLTETLGALPRRRAAAFVDEIRADLAACEESDLGSDVVQIVDRGGDDREVAAWRVTSEISEDRSVDFLMAVVRNGTGVAQLGFVPADRARLGEDGFVALAERAADRLTALKPPRN